MLVQLSTGQFSEIETVCCEVKTSVSYVQHRDRAALKWGLIPLPNDGNDCAGRGRIRVMHPGGGEA